MEIKVGKIILVWTSRRIEVR